MATSTENARGRVALMVGHCAGMIDLVALPVWVGALIARYSFDPPHAGGLVTLFLLGAMASSLVFAPRFNALNRRAAVALGFLVAALSFGVASRVSGFAALAGLHALAGAAAGCALSFTHGTIAHSANPHRLFALVNFALGVFAILFLGATPNLIQAFGGHVLFVVFSGVMAVGALVAALAFPSLTARPEEDLVGEIAHLPPDVWFGVVGVSCMGLTQALMFSFLERIGLDRGYGAHAVTGLLIGLGFVNLTPAPLAAFLQTRLSSRTALFLGPVAQCLVALAIALPFGFGAYAAGALLLAGVMIFTHTFAFGTLAKLDPTSRALAGTPAMLMVGAAIGPFLGGALAQGIGYPALGAAAVVLDFCAVVLFARLHRAPQLAAARA